MGDLTPIFNERDTFHDYKIIEEKLKLYTETLKYEFVATTGKKLETVCKGKTDYIVNLIYDERYFRCRVNPKPDTLKNFKRKHPGINVKLGPAILIIRTTKDIQQLKVTKFQPDHDHEPSAPPRLTFYMNLNAENSSHQSTDFNLDEPVQVSLPRRVFDSTNQSSMRDTTNRLGNVLLAFSDTNLNTAQILLDSEVLQPTPPAASVSIINDPDNFDALLPQLRINIESTASNEVKKRKVLEVIKTLSSLNIDLAASDLQPLVTSGTLSTSATKGLSFFMSRSRGRGRGRRDRVIGLPVRPMTKVSKIFKNLKETSKIIQILSMIFTDKVKINQIVLGKRKINKDDLNHLLPKAICDGLASEMTDVNLIEKFFDSDAFETYETIIDSKIKNDDFQCNVCKYALNTDYSIECDQCLYLSHWKCVNLSEEPPNLWFCPDCNEESQNCSSIRSKIE